MWLELLALAASKFWFFALHSERFGSFPKPLSREQEKGCFEAASKGDMSARNRLIEHNLRLVAHIVKKYAAMPADQDDLQSIGTIGLIKAVETFSPEKNTRFASYAARCIENEILMYFRSLKKSSGDVSINDPIETDRDGNPLTLFDLIADEENIADTIDLKLDSERLYQAVKAELDSRERLIVTLRYGLGGRRPLTQREIAKKLDISRSYVSRIEKRALEKLRRAF
ncbi:MAG: RNA polymerase sporulation sigma factor SigK [Oscillospiraceae bacterium]|jgi:RNA polymerase sporulation-specific sigma factor|nr:RNA polymerase sporulation sigma factor SigK [Oscillospiraceae bacterium]